MLSRAIAVPRRTGGALAALGFASLVVLAVLNVGAEGPEERSLAQRHWWKKRMAWKNRHDEFQSWFEEQRALQPSKIVSKAEAFKAWKVENARAAPPAKEVSARKKASPTASKLRGGGGLRPLVAEADVKAESVTGDAEGYERFGGYGVGVPRDLKCMDGSQPNFASPPHGCCVADGGAGDGAGDKNHGDKQLKCPVGCISSDSHHHYESGQLNLDESSCSCSHCCGDTAFVDAQITASETSCKTYADSIGESLNGFYQMDGSECRACFTASTAVFYSFDAFDACKPFFPNSHLVSFYLNEGMFMCGPPAPAETKPKPTGIVNINNNPCPAASVVIEGNNCISGAPHHDFDGMVCANDGKSTEAYCTYALGPSACARCDSGSACADDESWIVHGVADYSCEWFRQHDPGCGRFHDVGQQAACPRTCGACEAVEPEPSPSPTPSTGALKSRVTWAL